MLRIFGWSKKNIMRIKVNTYLTGYNKKIFVDIINSTEASIYTLYICILFEIFTYLKLYSSFYSPKGHCYFWLFLFVIPSLLWVSFDQFWAMCFFERILFQIILNMIFFAINPTRRYTKIIKKKIPPLEWPINGKSFKTRKHSLRCI